jgi:hypothetical protein
MSPPVRVLHVFGLMDHGGAELRTVLVWTGQRTTA